MSYQKIVISLACLFLIGCVSQKPVVKDPVTPPPSVNKAFDSLHVAAKDTALTAPQKTKQVDVDVVSTPAPSNEIVIPRNALPEAPNEYPLITLDSGTVPEVKRPEIKVVVDTARVDSSAVPVQATGLVKAPAPVKKKMTIPEPLPAGKEPVILIDGWRVQLKVVSSERAAEIVADSARMATGEDIHVTWRSGHYKVMAGNYELRTEAETLRDSMRVHGYPDAFVVAFKAEVDTIQTLPDSLGGTGDVQLVDGWRIQIMSLGSMAEAKNAARKAERDLATKIYIDEYEDRYRLRIGNFRRREDVDDLREFAEKAGYVGAFPVQTKIEIPRRGRR